ncbi:hypothetical protein TSAR_012819 [Trichomalopsis sarcophagae]|uniref:Uncharacterized protein n=1 Tax=Trichomalopsis sarcophagae TaxID=543379 RepID=A0A232F3Z0_9HYME|nr:hypothetical protein TSAR_012819 [Trichomalopsis sarcophagae]
MPTLMSILRLSCYKISYETAVGGFPFELQILRGAESNANAVMHLSVLEELLCQTDLTVQAEKGAINAESTIASLKKEIDSLSVCISISISNNTCCIDGGSFTKVGSFPFELQILRVMHLSVLEELLCQTDLTVQAEKGTINAQSTIAQSMSGVNNLTSALENVDKIDDRTKDFVADFDEDNAAGPAQSMSGVNNLTSALENVDKIDDRTKDFVADFDEDNAAGPAL